MVFNNSRKNKKRQPKKELKDPVNFTRIISIFMLGFYAYTVIVVVILTMSEHFYTFQDFVIIAFPLLFLIIMLIYFLGKDEKIKINNLEVEKELTRIKQLYESRKKAEEQFDK